MKYDRLHSQTTRSIASTFGEPLTLRMARSGRRNSYGEWEAGGYDEKTASGSTEPVRRSQMVMAREIYPEGTRLEDMRIFYLDSRDDVHALKSGDSEADSDQIVWKKTTYRVVAVEYWGSHIVAHGRRLPDGATDSD